MEKKIFVGLTALGLLFVMVTSMLRLGNQKELNGSVAVYEKPQLSADTWLAGSYQSGLEQDTKNQYSFHNFNIRVYNQIRYSAFRTSNSVVIGKNNCYFENSYIEEALGTNPDIRLSDEEIEAIAEQIYEIQQEAIHQGKAFIYVITPSKADYCREAIPASYLAKDSYYGQEERNYIRLMQAFDRLGVCYLDSNEILQNTDLPVFYNSGIHWNRVSAVLTMNEIINQIKEQYGIAIKPLEMENIYEKADTTDEQDQDMAEMLNTFWAETDSKYYEANEQAVYELGCSTPKLFAQGGSFTNKLMEISRDNYLFSELHRMFYGVSMQDYNRGTGADTENLLDSDDLRYAIQDADIILLETNVENVSNLQPELYAKIYEHLCAKQEPHEIQTIALGMYGEENDGNTFCWAGSHILYEAEAPKDGASLQVQLELPIEQLKEKYGTLDETIKLYANGKLVREADYGQAVCQISVDREQLGLEEGEESVVLEIVAPYFFCPADSGSTDTRELAYKIRRIEVIGGEEDGI